MIGSTDISKAEIKMDANALYREDVFTDRKTGTIKILTPVDNQGNFDKNREVLYVGEAQLMTPMGAMPLTFSIEAGSLEDAAEMFPDAAKIAVEKAARELQELRREAASSIVIPEGVPGSGSGILGGGKIKMP